MKTSTTSFPFPPRIGFVLAALLWPGCVVVNDFDATADTDTDGSGATTGDETSDGADASSDSIGATSGDAPPESPSTWDAVWDLGPNSTAQYMGTKITASGDILATGNLEFPDTPIVPLFHRYSPGGQLLAQSSGPTVPGMFYSDACEGADGVVRVFGMVGDAESHYVEELTVFDYTPEGAPAGVHAYQGLAGSTELFAFDAHLACDEQGGVWLAAPLHAQGTLLVYFSPTGFAGEWWHEGHARALGYSSGALDLLLTISGVEGTLWRRVTTAGALVQELVIPSEAITLDVRGDRVVFAGNDGEPYADYVAMLDLAGVELWRHEQLDGVPFSVQGLALGPSGELALNARSSAPSFDRLFMMAPDGTIEWTHDLDFEGFGVVTVDMEIGDDGAVVLVGRGSWSTPEDDYVSPAWIARYAGPSE